MVKVWISGGNLEDSRRPRHFAPEQARRDFTLALLRARDRLSAGFADAPDDEYYRIAVGGEPEWVQDEESFTCSCGSPMEFVCQVSDSFQFLKLPDAPEQPDGSSARGYVLFLGNEVYVFACARQCEDPARWPLSVAEPRNHARPRLRDVRRRQDPECP